MTGESSTECMLTSHNKRPLRPLKSVVGREKIAWIQGGRFKGSESLILNPASTVFKATTRSVCATY
jgi:hypothetical protein